MGVSRARFFRSFQVIRLVDPILDAQYEAEEIAIQQGTSTENARQAGWHQSFHASSFPLPAETSCERKLLYGLMALPAAKPRRRFNRAIMEAGIAIEDAIVDRFDRAGVLLSKIGGTNKQTNFKASNLWLTGNVDAIILPPGYGAPHPVEIKSTSLERVNKMIVAQEPYKDDHYAQLMCYIWFTRMSHKGLGYDKLGLEPCNDGTILYVARDNPSVTAEFYVEYDEAKVQESLMVLVKARTDFMTDHLPERDKAWRWTEHPCKWCEQKPLCKKDVKEDVVKLSKSNVIDFAKAANPAYDFDALRDATIKRWQT